MSAEPAQVASDGRVLLKNVTFVELCGVCQCHLGNAVALDGARPDAALPKMGRFELALERCLHACGRTAAWTSGLVSQPLLTQQMFPRRRPLNDAETRPNA